MGLPLCGGHAGELSEVAIEGLLAGKTGLFGYLDKFLTVDCCSKQLLGMLYAHTVDVVGEGAVVRAVDVVGDVGAVGTDGFRQVGDLEVLLHEILLADHHSLYLTAYQFGIVRHRRHGECLFGSILKVKLIDGEIAVEADVTERELHDGECHGDGDEQPEAFAEELLADGVGQA